MISYHTSETEQEISDFLAGIAPDRAAPVFIVYSDEYLADACEPVLDGLQNDPGFQRWKSC